MKKQSINLVLSGGAAKGLAHIGVIEVLQREFKINSIIGSSMGSIIGGLYSYGYSTSELLEMAKTIKTVETLKFIRPDIIRKGLIRSANFLDFLKQTTRNARIENLKIPFATIAYDMKSQTSVTFENGGLAEAMLASSSIPFLFEPFNHEGYLFYDGGIEYPLPIEFHDIYGKADLIVGVSCTPQLLGKPKKFLETGQKIKMKAHSTKLAMTAFDINQTFLTMRSLERVRPDIYIPDYDQKLSLWDFEKVDEFYKLGIETAETAVEDFRSTKNNDYLNQFLKRSSDVLDDIKKLISVK